MQQAHSLLTTLRTAFLLTLATLPAEANWRTLTGWNELQSWAAQNSVTLPSGANVIAGMVEAGNDYLIDASHPQFSDISTISNIAGSSNGISGHANGVGFQFFGNTLSVTPDVDIVRMYSVNEYVARIQSTLTDWPEDVMSHAYVSTQTLSVNDTTILCSAMDTTTSVDGVLHIVGGNNGSSTTLPQIWSHTFNSITVGRTDGLHSAGTINAGYPGAGRQKPEVVCPLGTTSGSTGAVSSLATLLKSRALTHNSSQAQLPVVLKSCILAGADKTPFPQWNNTTTRPIDAVYGAGEIDILNSFRIIHTDEQSPGTIGNYGWDYFAPTQQNNFPQTYSFTIPDTVSSASLSANLSWNIQSTVGRYAPLGNLSLTLQKVTTNPDTQEQTSTEISLSDSPVDNLEHIWQPQLSPGDYTLTVDRNDNMNTVYALAWRIDLETNSTPATFTQGETENNLVFTGLFPNYSYTIQRSSNLSTWTTVVEKNSDATGTLSHNDPNTTLGQEVFYRLKYFTP